MVTTELGNCILKSLGLNKIAFCAVFNNYFQKNFEKISEIADKHNQSINVEDNLHSPDFFSNLQTLLNQSMGKGNMIISHKIHGKDKVYRSKGLDIGILKYKSFYGGKSKKAKGVYIEITTKSLIFTINIRNKGGGIYPSHIMCDFKYHNDQMLL